MGFFGSKRMFSVGLLVTGVTAIAFGYSVSMIKYLKNVIAFQLSKFTTCRKSLLLGVFYYSLL